MRGSSVGNASVSNRLSAADTVRARRRGRGLTSRPDNPVAKVKRFKEPKSRDRILSVEEEDRLLGALPDPYRTLTQLAVETGMRLQREGIPLTWADLDLTKGHLHI